MENYLASEEEIINFITNIREKLIVRKNKQELCNRIYPTIKNIISKSLMIYEKVVGRKMHIFNDEFHPIRFSTETKIDFLYNLLKTEITDRDTTTLIDLLYDMTEP